MEHFISLLTNYGYLILFPLAVVEGPILSVIAGLLCALKILNPFLVVPVIVSGDLVGDCFLYGLGRWTSKTLPPHPVRRFIPSPQKIKMVRGYFDTNPVRTIAFSKIFLGIGLAGLYMAGYAKLPYKKFLLICFGASVFQSTVYVIIGFLFGAAYRQIGSLLNGFTTFTILAAAAAAFFFFIKSKLKNI